MSEKVVNLFLYLEGKFIKSLGATAHDFDGNDEQAKAFLQSRVAVDVPFAIRYPLPVANIKTWLGLDAGQGLPLEIFDYLNFPTTKMSALRAFNSLEGHCNSKAR